MRFRKSLILCIALLWELALCDPDPAASDRNVGDKQFIYNTYKYNTLINVTVNNETEQILDFSEDSSLYRGFPTRVHVSTNDSVSVDHPIFITATQQKGVSSWELPLQISASESMLFTNMARTLCPHDAGPNITYVNRPQLTLSTFSANNVSVNVKLRRVVDFYVPLDQEVEVMVTPSTPKYYYFSFDSEPPNNLTRNQQLLPRFNYTIPKSVILMVESDDEVCALVSIQNNSCPVFDNEKDALYQGYHQTMTTKGGITLTQNMFPSGFYVMFIVKQTDDECLGANDILPSAESLTTPEDRVKTFRFRVITTISYKEYVIGALVTLALIFLVAILVTIVALPAFSCAPQAILVPVVDVNPEAPGPSGSRDPLPAPAHTKEDNVSDEDSLSDSIPEWPDALAPLTVAGLSRAKPRAHNRRSDRYFWSALTVAVVYALPVVQLLYTYQHMVFQTGNQDLCYYNFLCAHPLGALQLSDFNHVLSNIGYVLLGLIFMVQVRVRQKNPSLPGLGIPQHSGLFYSMGLALAMEGLLSACYHLCPNKMNFQFDSSFMYVIAVIAMVKLYQNRHPDVNASAHATFMLLALLIVIGLFGIMFPSVYFWVFFTILHLLTCFVLTVKIYYVGQFKLEWVAARRSWTALRARGAAALRPRYTARAVLLALANAANWALAAYGLYMHKRDFARHLLAILMGNTILYTWFYVAMKLTKREKVAPPAWVYFVCAHAAWFLAGKLFLDSRTKWSESPAQSRRHNAVCSALQFYDSHDLWHVASAAALYLSFNLLLVIDYPLRNTSRDLIPVF